MVAAEPTSNGYDIAATAGFYSAMAGVLAGFAFAAIIFLLAPRVQGEGRLGDNVDHVLKVLMSAFAGLVISTLLNALLAGEAKSHGRAAIEEIIAGSVLAISTLLLFYGIQLLLHGQDLETAAELCRTLVVAVGPGLAAMFILAGAGDVEVDHVGSPDEVRWFPVVLIEGILTASLIGYCLYRWRRPAPWEVDKQGHVVRSDYARRIPGASVAVFVALAVTFAVITNLADQGFQAPTPVVIVGQAAVFFFVGWFVRTASRRPAATPLAGDASDGQLTGIAKE